MVPNLVGGVTVLSHPCRVLMPKVQLLLLRDFSTQHTACLLCRDTELTCFDKDLESDMLWWQIKQLRNVGISYTSGSVL